MVGARLTSFTKLDAWHKSHEFVLGVLRTCEGLPRYDSIRTQLERAAVSITSNIAEGFGRQSMPDKRHFYTMARGSMYEVQNQLLIIKDMKRLSEEEFHKLALLSLDSTRLLHGLIRSTKKEQTNS